MNFKLFPDAPSMHSVSRLHDVAQGRDTSELLEMHYLELPKFEKERPSTLRTPSERWLHLLKFAERYERGGRRLPASLRREDGIAMAIDKMRSALADERVQQMMFDREKAENDYYAGLAAARTDGRAEGREEGRIEIARKMRDEGLDDDVIFRVTGVRLDSLT